jgi:hypothetical protein
MLKKLHYSILMTVAAMLAFYCIWYVLTRGDSGMTDTITLGGAMLFTIATVIIALKVAGPKKADVLCTRCRFCFKTGKY